MIRLRWTDSDSDVDAVAFANIGYLYSVYLA